MNGELCVVTGATSGIGRATAIGLARLGARVVIVARNAAKAEMVVKEISALPNAFAAEVVLADLTEMNQVRRAAEEISTRFHHVDVLINNAGGLFDTFETSSDGIERAYGVNHLSSFVFTLALHESLKKAAKPRVVMVNSGVHERAAFVGDYASLVQPKYEWSKVYAQTKLRNMIFTRALSERWRHDGITVNALHPGVVDTGLMSAWKNPVIKAFFNFVQLFFMSPEKGARTSIFVASDPSVAGVTGEYFDRCRPHPHNPVADEVSIQEAVWAESTDAVNGAAQRRGLLPSPAPSLSP